MKPLVYATRALEDLEAILRYVGSDDAEAAVRLVRAIQSQCEAIQRTPGIGERQEDLARLLRRFCFRRYAIYYRDLENQVRIERVLHGARDVGSERFE